MLIRGEIIHSYRGGDRCKIPLKSTVVWVQKFPPFPARSVKQREACECQLKDIIWFVSVRVLQDPRVNWGPVPLQGRIDALVGAHARDGSLQRGEEVHIFPCDISFSPSSRSEVALWRLSAHRASDSARLVLCLWKCILSLFWNWYVVCVHTSHKLDEEFHNHVGRKWDTHGRTKSGPIYILLDHLFYLCGSYEASVATWG